MVFRFIRRTLLYKRKTKLILIFVIIFLVASNLSMHVEYFNRFYTWLFYEPKENLLKVSPDMFDLKGQQIYLQSECGCNRRFDKIIITKRGNVYEISRNNDQNILHRFDAAEFESMTFTCDLYRTLRRGKNQKVISVTIYGENHMFKEALFSLVEQAKRYYQDWVIRVHHDNDKLLDVCQFECEHDNIDFCDISSLPMGVRKEYSWNANFMHGMMWRWLPITDDFVDYFASRDIDVCLIKRETDAVERWLKTTKLFHIMRDSPKHNAHIPGGLWAFANKHNRSVGKKLFNIMIDPSLAKLYNKNRLSLKYYDQYFLSDYIWYYAKENAFIHDSYFCDSYGVETEPFPSKREENNFYVGMSTIGCPVSETNQIEIEQCPETCRPGQYKSWVYC